MSTYFYSKVTTGYRWNLLKRCLWEVGIEPTSIGDTDTQTFLEFSRDLTTQEKTILDGIMASNPQNKPSTGVSIGIKDLWGGEDGANFTLFKTACNLPNLRLFYEESVVGSGIFDRVVLWHPTALTNTQKNAVKSAYTNLFIG